MDSIDPALQHDLDLLEIATRFYMTHFGHVTGAQLDQPSTLPGWTRKHVALHVAFNAEGFMRLAEWARTGVRNDMYPSRDWRNKQIETAVASLSGDEVRAIVHESVTDLADDLAALTPEQWDYVLINGRGVEMSAAGMPWLRARELFIHALDLSVGAKPADFPAEIVDRLLRDVDAEWERHDRPVHYRLEFTDREAPMLIHHGHSDSSPEEPVVVRGTAAEILGYVSGRGAGELSGAESLPAPPPWL